MPATLEQIAQAQSDFLGELETDIGTALTALGTLANREYGYTHTDVVIDDLESDYQTIITANPSLTMVSAVGILAILKDGDIVTAQGNRLFINGSEESGDYSFSGTNSQNGVELVKIWYFNDSTLNLVKPEFNVNKLIKIEGIGTIDVPNDFYDYCDEVRYSGYLNGDNVAIKKQVNSASGVLNDKLSSQLYEYTSNCTELPGSPVTINLTQLKKVSFPNLTTINISSGTNGLSGCTLLEEMYMPKLTTIYGNTYQDPRRGAFYNVKTVTIPESVDSIGRYSFHTNVKVILNCKNATAIADDAFYNAPTESFVMCSDWGASFNASVAAANWTLQQFIDFLNDSLRDMTLTNQTRTLTIPSARLTELQADTDGAAAIAAANAKGWTIGGA